MIAIITAVDCFLQWALFSMVIIIFFGVILLFHPRNFMGQSISNSQPVQNSFREKAIYPMNTDAPGEDRGVSCKINLG